MEPRDRIDAFGAASLTLFSVLLALNQVAIALVGEALEPTLFAGIRSALAAGIIAAVMAARGVSFGIEPGTVGPGLLIGAVFAGEFVCLFTALDLTGVTRVSVIFYTMPLWLALIGRLVIPGERLGGVKISGLVLAFAGVAWAIASREGASGDGALAGDLLALGGALCWAGIALIARGSRLSGVAPEMQLMWQVVVSVPILIGVSTLMGPALRAPAWWHLWPAAFCVAVSSLGFVFWLRLLAIYPASGVASFSFLAPLFGVALGWALLGEEVGPDLLASAALVAAGLVLINRPAGAGVRSRRTSP